MKPHLRFRKGLWECTSIYERGTGYGASIRAAYYSWLDEWAHAGRAGK